MPLQRQHIEFHKEYFNHYYLCNYQPRYTGNDELSESLIKFKMCDELHVRAWSECSVLSLKKLPFHEELIIIRALGSQETHINEGKTGLDKLGNILAEKLNCRYIPECLTKKSPTRSLKQLSKTEREVTLENIYVFKAAPAVNEIFIIDDIFTTGTTLKEIVRSVREALQEVKITLFTLAVTDHLAFLNKELSLTGYSYEWTEKEWQIVAESSISYSKVELLKKKILNNSF